jgi:hypothetical protein
MGGARILTGAAVAFMGGIERMTLSGALSTTDTASPVVSSARTWTVPPTNTGRAVFSNVIPGGGIGETPQYKQNADSFTNITEALEVTFATTDQITVRCSLAVGHAASFTLTDKDTAHVVEDVNLARV